MPAMEPYNSNADPIDHLQSFISVMVLHGVSDAIMCRAFPTMLRGAARTWYTQLKSRSIENFKQLSKSFVENFVTSKDHKNSSINLMTMKQQQGESLREYVRRFDREALKVRYPDASATFAALMGGIRDEQLNFSLSKKPPQDMGQLLARCEKYINAGETMKAMSEAGKDEGEKKKKGKDERESNAKEGKKQRTEKDSNRAKSPALAF